MPHQASGGPPTACAFGPAPLPKIDIPHAQALTPSGKREVAVLFVPQPQATHSMQLRRKHSLASDQVRATRQADIAILEHVGGDQQHVADRTVEIGALPVKHGCKGGKEQNAGRSVRKLQFPPLPKRRGDTKCAPILSCPLLRPQAEHFDSLALLLKLASGCRRVVFGTQVEKRHVITFKDGEMRGIVKRYPQCIM